ncbi:unnamed protein product [Heterosigma akashiwo]
MTNADRGKNYVLSVVASYWFVSISMVYLNKYLMNGNELSAPLFVTWYQCVVTCAIIYWCSAEKEKKVRAAGNKMMEKSGGKPGFFEKFPVIRMDFEVAKQIMPLSVIFVGMITFNNLCLKYVEVSFLQRGAVTDHLLQRGLHLLHAGADHLQPHAHDAVDRSSGGSLWAPRARSTSHLWVHSVASCLRPLFH